MSPSTEQITPSSIPHSFFPNPPSFFLPQSPLFLHLSDPQVTFSSPGRFLRSRSMFPTVFSLPKPGAKLSTLLHVGQVMGQQSTYKCHPVPRPPNIMCHPWLVSCSPFFSFPYQFIVLFLLLKVLYKQEL